MPLFPETITATISSGGSLSAAAPLGAKTLVGIAMPAGWDAASMTFQASPDGGTTWLELYDAGTQPVIIAVAASQFIRIDPSLWRGINMIKVRSGQSGSAVTQSADRVISLIVRPV